MRSKFVKIWYLVMKLLVFWKYFWDAEVLDKDNRVENILCKIP